MLGGDLTDDKNGLGKSLGFCNDNEGGDTGFDGDDGDVDVGIVETVEESLTIGFDGSNELFDVFSFLVCVSTSEEHCLTFSLPSASLKAWIFQLLLLCTRQSPQGRLNSYRPYGELGLLGVVDLLHKLVVLVDLSLRSLFSNTSSEMASSIFLLADDGAC